MQVEHCLGVFDLAMANSGEEDGLEIKIHPLVVMSVADHFTRGNVCSQEIKKKKKKE